MRLWLRQRCLSVELNDLLDMFLHLRLGRKTGPIIFNVDLFFSRSLSGFVDRSEGFFLDRSLSDVSRCVCFGWVLSLGRSEVVFWTGA